MAKVVTFGAFVEILPGVEGLVHISELAPHHVENPREVVSQGEAVNVRILEIDGERRRLSLSLKRVEEGDAARSARGRRRVGAHDARPEALRGGVPDVAALPRSSRRGARRRGRRGGRSPRAESRGGGRRGRRRGRRRGSAEEIEAEEIAEEIVAEVELEEVEPRPKPRPSPRTSVRRSRPSRSAPSSPTPTSPL